MESANLELVADLLAANPLLADLWDTSKENPLIVPQRIHISHVSESTVVRKTGRDERDEEQAKRRLTEAKRCEGVLLEKMYPILHARQSYPGVADPIWVSTRALADPKSVLVLEVGTALCISGDVYDTNVLVRVVLTDFLSEAVLLDLEVNTELEIVDLRPSSTGLNEVSPEKSVSFEQGQRAVLDLIDHGTLCLSSNPGKCMHALRMNHPKWMSLNELFQVDVTKKKQGESEFHIRNVLSVPQVLESFLCETMAYDRLKVMEPHERLTENSIALARLVKQAALKASAFPIVIECPRRHHAIFLSHIPADWTENELSVVMPKAIEIEPIDFQLDPNSNQWRGETVALFKSQSDLLAAFSRLTTCTDMFVGWEWNACGKVTESSLRELGQDFGPVVGVRIPEKYLEYRITAPNKDAESRPFGFISMAKYQDAVSMAKEPRQIEKNGHSYHVKISKKPISAFKRVPLGEEGEDYIEAFVM